MSGVDRFVNNVSKKEPNLEEEIEEIRPFVNMIKKYLPMVENMAYYSLLLSTGAYNNPNIKKTLTGEFQPPRDIIIYIVRMGSFQSKPKIMNGDNEDNDFLITPQINRNNLIELCQNEKNATVMLIDRNFLPIHKDGLSCTNNIRVLQWNILAQTLGLLCDSFVKCPKEALAWDYRKYHIIEEIIRSDSDIVCLQEVDHFSFINKVLKTQGFEGHFCEKPDSPCVYMKGNNGPDGCALFYKTDKFECLAVHTRILEVWNVESNQVVIVAILRCKKSGKEICIVGTHLKAKKGAILMHLRNEQVRDMLQFVSGLSQGRPVVICGDFNGEPIEPFYKNVLSHRDLKLSSAYAEFNKQSPSFEPTVVDEEENFESKYTTWKIREKGEECHTIDYIFYSSLFMNLEGVLKIPTPSEIGENRLPSLRYPSDHFALVSEFSFKD